MAGLLQNRKVGKDMGALRARVDVLQVCAAVASDVDAQHNTDTPSPTDRLVGAKPIPSRRCLLPGRQENLRYRCITKHNHDKDAPELARSHRQHKSPETRTTNHPNNSVQNIPQQTAPSNSSAPSPTRNPNGRPNHAHGSPAPWDAGPSCCAYYAGSNSSSPGAWAWWSARFPRWGGCWAGRLHDVRRVGRGGGDRGCGRLSWVSGWGRRSLWSRRRGSSGWGRPLWVRWAVVW